jgi:hypothetical protein
VIGSVVFLFLFFFPVPYQFCQRSRDYQYNPSVRLYPSLLYQYNSSVRLYPSLLFCLQFSRLFSVLDLFLFHFPWPTLTELCPLMNGSMILLVGDFVLLAIHSECFFFFIIGIGVEYKNIFNESKNEVYIMNVLSGLP